MGVRKREGLAATQPRLTRATVPPSSSVQKRGGRRNIPEEEMKSCAFASPRNIRRRPTSAKDHISDAARIERSTCNRLQVCPRDSLFKFEFFDNNVSLINKIMKFFLYYFNYSEFNLENSDILYFGA